MIAPPYADRQKKNKRQSGDGESNCDEGEKTTTRRRATCGEEEKTTPKQPPRRDAVTQVP
jgi:hypothetical protein